MPGLLLTPGEIDIAHRLGKPEDETRPVIVKFVSRMRKDSILKKRRAFKDTRIFLNEDFTGLNGHVLKCLRKKMPDEVQEAWSSNGVLFYKDKLETIRKVPYKDYNQWLELPWPKDAE